MNVKVLVLEGEGHDVDNPDLFLVVPEDAHLVDVLEWEVDVIAEVNSLENAIRIARLWNRENHN